MVDERRKPRDLAGRRQFLCLEELEALGFRLDERLPPVSQAEEKGLDLGEAVVASIEARNKT
jgi:hypothetical protein